MATITKTRYVQPYDVMELWAGSKSSAGYGQIRIGGKLVYVHRLTAELFIESPLPKNCEVCHKCNIPACYEPEHLYIGDKKSNMRDASLVRQLYGQATDVSGTRSNASRFSKSDLKRIYLLKKVGRTLTEIADIFKTSKTNVWKFVSGKTYKNELKEIKNEVD